MSIEQILKNTNYHLDLFSDSEIAALESCEFKSLLQEVRDEAHRAGTLTQDLLLP